MDKYKNKYRIPSARATWWDYGWAGAYFITICTKNREHYFGEIRNGKMHLSHWGVLADVLWHEIPHHAKNVELGEFVRICGDAQPYSRHFDFAQRQPKRQKR
jgi:hypothetical protein